MSISDSPGAPARPAPHATTTDGLIALARGVVRRGRYRCPGHSRQDLEQEAAVVALQHADSVHVERHVRRHLEALVARERRRAGRQAPLDAEPAARDTADLPRLADLSLDTLTARERLVLERTAEGAPDPVIAGELGCTLDAVRKARSRAAARVREENPVQDVTTRPRRVRYRVERPAKGRTSKSRADAARGAKAM